MVTTDTSCGSGKIREALPESDFARAFAWDSLLADMSDKRVECAIALSKSMLGQRPTKTGSPLEREDRGEFRIRQYQDDHLYLRRQSV